MRNTFRLRTKEALEACTVLARTEGIIPALESAHAVAEVIKRAPRMKKSDVRDREHLRTRRQGYWNLAREPEAGLKNDWGIE